MSCNGNSAVYGVNLIFFKTFDFVILTSKKLYGKSTFIEKAESTLGIRLKP